MGALVVAGPAKGRRSLTAACPSDRATVRSRPRSQTVAPCRAKRRRLLAAILTGCWKRGNYQVNIIAINAVIADLSLAY
jgi:hypothetical protein